jgi:penicillin-binding protein 1A
MTDMLCNAVNRGTGWLSKFGSMEIAGKSGGSSSWKDRWYIAYTPYLLAACWTGYDIPQNMGSSNPATGMWKQVMQDVHAYLGYADTKFEIPEGMKRVTICCDTGLLASEACEHEIRGSRTMTLYMRPEDIPTSVCEAHVYADICKDSMDAVGPDCPEFSRVRYSVLDPTKYDGEMTLPLFFLNGVYPKRVNPNHYSSDEDYRLALVAYEEKLASATPYVLQDLIPCRKHNLDPATGWIVEYPHGYLIDPDSGMYYDTENDILIDQYSMLQVDWYTGYLIDADTGEFIDPYTGQKVYLTEEQLAAYTRPKFRRPPGYGPPETEPAPDPTPEPEPAPEPSAEPPEAASPEPGGGEAPPEDAPTEGDPEDLFFGG